MWCQEEAAALARQSSDSTSTFTAASIFDTVRAPHTRLRLCSRPIPCESRKSLCDVESCAVRVPPRHLTRPRNFAHYTSNAVYDAHDLHEHTDHDLKNCKLKRQNDEHNRSPDQAS